MMLEQFLPVLGDAVEQEFNVFDVMHHGTHEKQLSNVFGWLLNSGGSHQLGDGFMRIFVGEVNRQVSPEPPLPCDGYAVRQEVDTSTTGEAPDIADLVLERPDAALVVENYFTSDGHGHDYEQYLRYADRDGRQGAVVLLCRDEDETRLAMGWERSVVLTYRSLLAQLHDELTEAPGFAAENPQVHWFIEQMHHKFVRGQGMASDDDVLEFVSVMCQTGEAGRYRMQNQAAAAEQFASDLADQARQRFGESREMLQRIKGRLAAFVRQVLIAQLEQTLTAGAIHGMRVNYFGVYQWTVSFDIRVPGAEGASTRVSLKFGPSAWFVHDRPGKWKHTVPAAEVDYSHLLLTSTGQMAVQQSAVSLREVLDGLAPEDKRLHDEIIGLLGR